MRCRSTRSKHTCIHGRRSKVLRQPELPGQPQWASKSRRGLGPSSETTQRIGFMQFARDWKVVPTSTRGSARRGAILRSARLRRPLQLTQRAQHLLDVTVHLHAHPSRERSIRRNEKRGTDIPPSSCRRTSSCPMRRKPCERRGQGRSAKGSLCPPFHEIHSGSRRCLWRFR